MYLFGRNTWLRHGDPFALAFSVLARFAPTEMRVERQPSEVSAANGGVTISEREQRVECNCDYEAPESLRRWILRPPGAGLLDTKNVTPSLVVFVLVMLSTVTFDGLMATPLWQRIENTLYEGLSALGNFRLAIINTLGLLSFCAIFICGLPRDCDTGCERLSRVYDGGCGKPRLRLDACSDRDRISHRPLLELLPDSRTVADPASFGSIRIRMEHLCAARTFDRTSGSLAHVSHGIHLCSRLWSAM